MNPLFRQHPKARAIALRDNAVLLAHRDPWRVRIAAARESIGNGPVTVLTRWNAQPEVVENGQWKGRTQ